MRLALASVLLLLSACGSARKPPPIPVPQPSTEINLNWEHDGSDVEYFSIRISPQSDPTWEDQWTEVARATEVPGPEGLMVDVPDRPAFLVVVTICECEAETPSNVLRIR